MSIPWILKHYCLPGILLYILVYFLNPFGVGFLLDVIGLYLACSVLIAIISILLGWLPTLQMVWKKVTIGMYIFAAAMLAAGYIIRFFIG